MSAQKVPTGNGPLAGVRVLELGSLIAGPFAAHLAADFGAEVIKIEPPGKGDEIRAWRYVPPGSDNSLWWYNLARNKKSITLDMRREEGQDIVRRLVQQSDAVVENFRPGRLAEWGLSYEHLREVNPRIIMVSVSGYGQTGPHREKPGFASVAEGISGIRYLTGFPDRPPVRAGISLGDHVAALYAALGLVMALYHRDARGGVGQHVDLALYEAMFTFSESLVPEYYATGAIWERVGTALLSTVPSNTYPTRDERWVIIGANNNSLFARLCRAMGRPELATDPRFKDNQGRVRERQLLDAAVADWTRTLTLAEVVQALAAAEVPGGPIYTAAEIVEDPQYLARDMLIKLPVPGLEDVRFPGVVPKMNATPGQVTSGGPELGQHNHYVYRELLGLSEAELADLQQKGIV